MRRITIENPLNPGTELRVSFKVHKGETWGYDADAELLSQWGNDEEADITVEIRRVEEGNDGVFDDVSDSWIGSADMEELEAEVQREYIERQRAKYADRMAKW